PSTSVFWGDGDGRFGQRAHALAAGDLVVRTDLDGDGADDLVFATSTPGIQVLFSDRHQLAYGPETVIPFPLIALAAGRLRGTGTSLILQQNSGDLFLADLDGQGRLSPPLPLHQGPTGTKPSSFNVQFAELGGA